MPVHGQCGYWARPATPLIRHEEVAVVPCVDRPVEALIDAYRLGKIEERTGCDLRCIADVIALLIALCVHGA